MTGRGVFSAGLSTTLAALFVAGPAFAQGAAEEEEGPKVQSIQMVERGFFLETDVGVTGFVATLGLDTGDDRKYGAATQIGIFAGYDVLPILSVGAGLRAYGLGVSGTLTAAAGADDAAAVVQGDLYYLAPMLTARLALLTTERNFFWVRADVGLGIGFPGKIDGVDYGGFGPCASVFGTYERFTKLRHFSIGASLGATLLTAPALGIGISFMPHVKYTF